MNNLKIRKAKLSDLKIVRDLNAELFKFDGPRDKFINHQWPYKEGEKYFKKMIKGDKTVCLVAKINKEIVGYLAGAVTKKLSYRIVKKRIELENIFVVEKYRGKGVGSKLVEEFFKWGREQKATRILVVAYATNYKAIEFYKKNKFSPFSFSLEAGITK
jgi:ribosomal protein S18 acetylase RimI-like enzyme